MKTSRIVPWNQYFAERPGMAGCPANGVLAVSLDWMGDELVRVEGVLQGGRDVVLVDLTSEPRPILSASEVDDLVKAAAMALPA